MQVELYKQTLEELEKNKADKVQKLVGNILFEKPASEVKKEVKEKQESMELRLKTVVKQEEALVSKLNSLKKTIESNMPQQGNDTVMETEKPKKTSKKKKK